MNPIRAAAALVLLWALAPAAGAQLIVAHRGASYDAPENTLAAFRLAWLQGADGIEGDFFLSRDGRVVCIHDAETGRLADRNLVVRESTYDDLRQLDVGSWKADRWTGQRIPTLEQVLETVPPGKKIFVELKTGPEIVAPVQRVLQASRVKPVQVVFIAFNAHTIAECKRRMPDIKAHWLTGYAREGGAWKPTAAEIAETLRRTAADGLGTEANPRVVDAAFVAALRKGGLREFHAWTIDDPLRAGRFRALGAVGLTTNRPAYLREHLPTPDLRRHLLLHLKLDGDLQDSSPHARRVEAAGDARPAFVDGVFGQALDMGQAATPVAVACKLPQRGTFCAWYYPMPWYDYQTIFDNAAGRDAWEMWIYRSGRLRFRIHPRHAGVAHRFHPTGDAGEWHHLAVSWDREDRSPRALRLYVNGRPAAAAALPGDAWQEPGELFYLGGGNEGNRHGNGRWDDAALLDVPVTPGDVRLLMNLGVEKALAAFD